MCWGEGGGRGMEEDLPEIVWFQAVPFVFLEEDGVLAGCCSFCLVSFISEHRARYSHCILSSRRAGSVHAQRNLRNCLSSHDQHSAPVRSLEYFIFILFFFSTKLLVSSISV